VINFEGDYFLSVRIKNKSSLNFVAPD